MSLAIDLAERGLVPDAALRRAIRRVLNDRLASLRDGGCEAQLARGKAFRESANAGPVALVPERANAQHYEVPTALFERVLGPRLKYSCCLFPRADTTLAAAEEAMLALTCARAGIEDGMDVIDLGCGWGSLASWIVERYPRCRVLAVSNSLRQRDHVTSRARSLGVENRLRAIRADVNDFAPERPVDRVVSVEMFEHVRNHARLLERIRRWLHDDGRLFVHLFCHREFVYPYEDAGPGDWMARHFFTGGMMPSDGMLPALAEHFRVEEHWRVRGTHYARTCRAWLRNLDANREPLLPVLERPYGAGEGARWFGRWRLFFLACAELFAFRGGDEWWVAHYRMRPRAAGRA